MCHYQRGDESWPLWLLGSLRFLPPPQLPTLSKKKVPVVLFGCLRKDKKKKVCFPLYPKNVSQHLFLSGIRRTRLFHHCSSSQTVKASRTQICGISHQKCDLVLKPKLQTSYLSDQGKAFLLEVLDVSHCLPLQGPQDWDTDRGQKRPRWKFEQKAVTREKFLKTREKEKPCGVMERELIAE